MIAIVVVVPVLLVVGSTIWVAIDHDATRRAYGDDHIGDSALMWVVGCLLLWVGFFPAYLFARSAQRSGEPIPPVPTMDVTDPRGIRWHRDAAGWWFYWQSPAGWVRFPDPANPRAEMPR
jgi:hypothetical protein